MRKGHNGYVRTGIQYTGTIVVEVVGLSEKVDRKKSRSDPCRGRVMSRSGVQGSRGVVRVDRVVAQWTGLY